MNTPSWLRTAVFYQVYPQSFCDSNGDGIGDLPGLISKLEYIRDLGCTAIWLNPIYVSPFGDAGYDVADFRRLAPRYGTTEDVVALFKRAHRLGIKIVLDLVAGHTSNQHPWFQAAATYPSSPYREYYIFTGDTPQTPMFGDSIPKTAAGEHFVANFLPFQPALSYGYSQPDPARPWQLPAEHPACLRVRTELRDIMRFWLELGCDGFRVDMASSLVRGEVDRSALLRLWQGFRSWLDRDYPEAALIAEWSHPTEAIAAGCHVDFLMHFGEPAYIHLVGPGNELHEKSRRPHVFFERAGEGDIRLFLENFQKHYKATVGRGYISLPTGNHDFQRSRRGRDFDDLKVLYTMLLTMPGVPFIYYGDEIGMRNIDGLPEKEGSMWRTGNRTPMQWNKDAPNLGFSEASSSDLYLPIDANEDAPTVSAQEENPDSLLHFTRQLLTLRRAHSALGNDGAFRPIYAVSGKYPFVYERSDATGIFYVAINPSEQLLTLDLPELAGATTILNFGAQLLTTQLHMPGVSAILLKLK